jgi:hypothetical protein
VGKPFRSFPTSRRPELYISEEHHFNSKPPEQQAKFIFRLTEEGAEYGFLVERSAGSPDATWDWERFVAALAAPGEWPGQVEAAMRDQGLQAEAELSRWKTKTVEEGGPVGSWKAGAGGLEFWAPGAEAGAPCTWQEMARTLSEASTGLWCDFYILGRASRTEAIALGERLLDRAAKAYAGLMPLYAASAR